MPIPFAPNRAFYEPSTRAQDIILRQGDDAARAAQRSGQIWGGAIQNLGGIASQVVQDRAEQKAMSRRDQAVAEVWQRSNGNPDIKDLVAIYGPKDGTDLAKNLAEFNAAKANPREDAISRFPAVAGIMAKLGEPLQEAFWNSEVIPVGQAAGILSEPIPWKPGIEKELLKGFMPEKNEAGFTLAPGQARFDSEGNKIAAVDPEAAKLDTRSLEIRAAEALAAGDTDAYQKILKAQRELSAAGRAPDTGSKAREWVMRPDETGKLVPVNVLVTDIRPGDMPANTRQQGRPIVSGDANRLADLDTSLSQANSLKNSMATGTTSWLGANLIPDVVTQFTGVGAESKGQQGVINLVKQIIGKALEGGVLRKEDEIKYEKILPKLGDPPEVAQTKINNLLQTLQDKKENLLGSLEDASYDVSKFRQRGADRAPALKAPEAKAPAKPKGRTIGRFVVEEEN